MLFVVSGTRTWGTLINCFEKTDMLCGWYLNPERHCWWTALAEWALPAEVRGHHAVNIDPVTELQRDGHREPAGAQPRVGDLPGTTVSPQAGKVIVTSNPILNPFRSKADYKPTFSLGGK